MKNKLIVSTLSFAFAAASFAADLTVNGSALSTDGWDWTDSANWTPAGSTVEGSNLNISGALDAANSSVIGSTLNAKNVSINFSSSNQFSTTLNAAATFDNLTIDDGNVLITANKNGLTVKDTLTISTTKGFMLQSDGIKSSIGKLVINGDKKNGGKVEIKGENVIGLIEMKAASGADGASLHLYTYNQFFGGLSGAHSENHKLSTERWWGGILEFKNAKGTRYSWRGEMVLANNTISLTGEGEQRLEITKFTQQNNPNDFVVTNGRLIIREEEGPQHGSLSIKGGLFKTEVKDISFKSGSFTGGGISVGNDSGTIFLETATKDSADPIVLDFAELTQVGDYDIISVTDVDNSTGFEWSRNDFVVKNLKEGLLASLGWKDGTFTASITSAVPEPATVAAILGVFALAFAAYRRRR